jgi:hypothetical protein
MRKRFLVGALLLLAAGAGLAVRADDPKPVPCCFTNPRYSGVCAVEPAKDETCADVLAYLNDPQSQGKNYCGNTTIRGGWAGQACVKPEAPQ